MDVLEDGGGHDAPPYGRDASVGSLASHGSSASAGSATAAHKRGNIDTLAHEDSRDSISVVSEDAQVGNETAASPRASDKLAATKRVDVTNAQLFSMIQEMQAQLGSKRKGSQSRRAPSQTQRSPPRTPVESRRSTETHSFEEPQTPSRKRGTHTDSLDSSHKTGIWGALAELRSKIENVSAGGHALHTSNSNSRHTSSPTSAAAVERSGSLQETLLLPDLNQGQFRRELVREFEDTRSHIRSEQLSFQEHLSHAMDRLELKVLAMERQAKHAAEVASTAVTTHELKEQTTKTHAKFAKIQAVTSATEEQTHALKQKVQQQDSTITQMQQLLQQMTQRMETQDAALAETRQLLSALQGASHSQREELDAKSKESEVQTQTQMQTLQSEIADLRKVVATQKAEAQTTISLPLKALEETNSKAHTVARPPTAEPSGALLKRVVQLEQNAEDCTCEIDILKERLSNLETRESEQKPAETVNASNENTAVSAKPVVSEEAVRQFESKLNAAISKLANADADAETSYQSECTTSRSRSSDTSAAVSTSNDNVGRRLRALEEQTNTAQQTLVNLGKAVTIINDNIREVDVCKLALTFHTAKVKQEQHTMSLGLLENKVSEGIAAIDFLCEHLGVEKPKGVVPKAHKKAAATSALTNAPKDETAEETEEKPAALSADQALAIKQAWAQRSQSSSEDITKKAAVQNSPRNQQQLVSASVPAAAVSAPSAATSAAANIENNEAAHETFSSSEGIGGSSSGDNTRPPSSPNAAGRSLPLHQPKPPSAKRDALPKPPALSRRSSVPVPQSEPKEDNKAQHKPKKQSVPPLSFGNVLRS